MVKKSEVERFMVERSGVEACGWQVRGWDVLQPGILSAKFIHTPQVSNPIILKARVRNMYKIYSLIHSKKRLLPEKTQDEEEVLATTEGWRTPYPPTFQPQASPWAFQPQNFQPWTFQPQNWDGKSGVEKSGVEKLMVEKSGVRKFMVE